MIPIKKVAVSKLKTGSVIDSFDTTDDKHNNAPSINAVDEKKQNKVLSGTSEPSNSLGKDGDVYLQYSS